MAAGGWIEGGVGFLRSPVFGSSVLNEGDSGPVGVFVSLFFSGSAFFSLFVFLVFCYCVFIVSLVLRVVFVAEWIGNCRIQALRGWCAWSSQGVFAAVGVAEVTLLSDNLLVFDCESVGCLGPSKVCTLDGV